MPPSKTEQVVEAAARAAAGVNPAEGLQATEVIDDGPRGDPGSAEPARAPIKTDAEGGAIPPQPPPFISKRAEIIARYSKDRAAEPVDNELAGLAQEGAIPLELRSQPIEAEPESEPAPAEGELQPESEPAETQAQEPPAPRKIKVKVHGQEMELTEDELVARAQIALASENILEEAKSLKKGLQDQIDQVSRLKGNAANQQQQPAGAQSPEQQQPSTSPEGGQPNQDGRVRELIEKMQYGDPDEAEQLLRQTIEERVLAAVQPAVQNEMLAERFRGEGARTAKVLADFKDQHADLAGDPFSEAAIQTRLFQLQVEDIRNLGVDPAQIQTPDGSPVTPGHIAQAHAYYRAKGFSVRAPEVMLNQAANDVQTWLKSKNPQPADPAPSHDGKVAPRVEVTVERQQRRQAIPQSPDRAAAPRQPVQTQVAQPRDRSDIVRAMGEKRSLPRGKVGLA
jgi:hypothetical protein